VDWFVFDVGTNGTGLAVAQNFVNRFNTGTDIPIGQHQPPIIAASITSRSTTLLAGLPTTSGGFPIALIAGVVAGVVVLILVVVILLIIVVRRRQTRDHYEHKQPLLQARYEPVHSYAGYGAASISSPSARAYEEPQSYAHHGPVSTVIPAASPIHNNNNNNNAGAAQLRRRSGYAIVPFPLPFPDPLCVQRFRPRQGSL
jgi:hypothetical protein